MRPLHLVYTIQVLFEYSRIFIYSHKDQHLIYKQNKKYIFCYFVTSNRTIYTCLINKFQVQDCISKDYEEKKGDTRYEKWCWTRIFLKKKDNCFRTKKHFVHRKCSRTRSCTKKFVISARIKSCFPAFKIYPICIILLAREKVVIR